MGMPWDSLLNLGGTIATNQSNLKAVRETNAANAALWREQNAYNTPAEQMKRLEAAGLNPNLAYGQVAESRASNPPAMESPHYEAPKFDIASNFASFQQVKNLQALNQQTTAHTEKIKADAITAASNADYTVWENDKLKKQGRLKSDSPILKAIGAGRDYVSDVVRRLNKAGANTPTKLLKHVGSVEVDHALLNASLLEERYGDQFDGGR